ncbi:MAG TPA: hypothetical protein VEQ87_23855 [Burkholderiales bacterium]|nr:hypothetical protein [Burkholderiales bacterium]
MLPRLLAAAVFALGALAARAQYADPNLQNLLAGLTSGNPVTLITPLNTGMLQVTSFRAPVRMSAADAAAYVDRARQELARIGLTSATAEEIARMLAGGPIDTPTGRYTLSGLLNAYGVPATLASQIVAPGTPVPSYGGSAAAGGTAPAAPVPAREAALQQLASIGILNPSEEQIRTALVGGTITTVNGAYQLPGILPRSSP